MAFHEGRGFIDLNSAIWNSLTSLHALLDSQRWHIDMVVLLLEKGARAGDLYRNGRSVLHYAIKGSRAATLEDVQQVLCLLLREGANPYVRNKENVSVSHIACDGNSFFESDGNVHSNNDSRLCEIWTSALSKAGYNAEEVINVGSNSQMPLHYHCYCGYPINYCTSDWRVLCKSCRKVKKLIDLRTCARPGCEILDEESERVVSEDSSESLSIEQCEKELDPESDATDAECNRSDNENEEDTVYCW